MGSVISTLLKTKTTQPQQQTAMTRFTATTEDAHNGNRSTNEVVQIFNYKRNTFEQYPHTANLTCEHVCIDMARTLNISPITRLLFSLRLYDAAADENSWAVPGQTLQPSVRYAFRMRFKVPDFYRLLQSLDPNAFEYLYRQMRSDMVRQYIPEIRYPIKKDYVMGLGVVDMYVDLQEQKDTERNITANYQRYLPQQLVKRHWVFCHKQIRNSFAKLIAKDFSLQYVKEQYVLEVHDLAPNYLMETYTAMVDSLNNEPVVSTTNGSDAGVSVRVKLDLYDTEEPGLKVARLTANDNLEWILITKLENCYSVIIEEEKYARLEITGLPRGYKLRFDNTKDLESFVTYLAGYVRLSCKWMFDICERYKTPSLQELNKLACHGPVGGNYSFARIREKRNQCGSYLVRQCEKKYDTYYIDINTPITNNSEEHTIKFKTETFKIRRLDASAPWILHYNNEQFEFDNLNELAHSIPTGSHAKFRIPPSIYDKPPLLLICLPKNLHPKKNETELSEAELHSKRVQIIHPTLDLQWYKDSERECYDGKMIEMRADWIQQGNFKDIMVTLKWLKSDDDYPKFQKLINKWSQVYSPQFIKLYGLTLSSPYALIMEHAHFGALNEVLQKHKDNVSMLALLDVVQGLVRGIVYLQERGIVHGYLRCCNLLVKKFDPKNHVLEAKIADPGLRTDYTEKDLPWIPLEYHAKNLRLAKDDADAEMWAFATTVWEIFAKGQPVPNLTSEDMHRNYKLLGGILPPPSNDCPEPILLTIMDGWSLDPDKRFNHHRIFERVLDVMKTLSSNYHILDPLCEPVQENEQEPSTSKSIKPFKMNGYLNDMPMVFRIEHGKIIRREKFGEGHYGTVYKGDLIYDNSDKVETVAIKMLKSNQNQISKDFMREIQIMQTLDHPNIVKIKVWMDNPISIIMEYVEGGSFIVYLNSNKPVLTNLTLLRFALNIAEGMKYLGEKHVIHRDLAARNILVGRDRERVKISDFGLAQIANSQGYYIQQTTRSIPIKWYSPESLRSGTFSFYSDVWSYGVTLFEMFSRGEVPDLSGTTDKSLIFVDRLERGDRLPKPALCPDIIYEKLMLPCWHAQPKLRPNFDQIIKQLHTLIAEYGEVI